MRLFEAPDDCRVRVRSKTVKWAIDLVREKTLAEDVVWEGTVTSEYYFHRGVRRRLIVDLNTVFWPGTFGIWQSDCDVEVLQLASSPRKQEKEK
jgi:hypothetical protein